MDYIIMPQKTINVYAIDFQMVVKNSASLNKLN